VSDIGFYSRFIAMDIGIIHKPRPKYSVHNGFRRPK